MSTMPLALLSALSAPFLIAAWVARAHRPSARPADPFSLDHLLEVPMPMTGFQATPLDLEPEVRAAAAAMATLARARGATVDLSVSPGSAVHMDRAALHTVLHAMLLVAIDATPGGQVLITAARLGAQMHIRVIDDGARADRASRERQMRDAGALIALQGGSIAVEARAGRGTTMTVCLPMPAGALWEPAWETDDEIGDRDDRAGPTSTLLEMPESERSLYRRALQVTEA
jgi:hypothetical protein